MGKVDITIRLTPDDVAETRFAFSPMLEMVISHKHLVAMRPDVRFRLWMDEMRRALYGIEFPYFRALTSSKTYVPDFITPTPMKMGLTIEDEIAAVLATPDELVRKNVLTLMQYQDESEILHHYLMYPHEALYCLVEELRLYWQRTLLRHWPRMKNVLEEDILYRARNMALGGYGTVIESLSPGIHYRASEIRFMSSINIYGDGVSLRGSGLQLVPLIFSGKGLMWQIVPEWQPMLIYSPRGTGLWWHELPEKPDQSLEIALGAGRANVLQALITPSTTSEVARRLTMTGGAVSQHLSRLRQAGLVESQRSAKRVYYSLTERGAHLLMLFDGSSYVEAVKNVS